MFVIIEPDSFKYEDEDAYCVKIGYVPIPGGCQIKECNDVGQCPYIQHTEISLNPSANYG